MTFTSLTSLGRYASLLLCVASAGFSQTVSLNLASDGSATPANLALNLSSTTGSEPAGVQFTVAYPPTLSNVTIDAGPAATAAGKGIVCTGPAGSKTCLVLGPGNQSIADGIVALVGWGTTPVGSDVTSFRAASGLAAGPDGGRLLTAVATNISIPTPVTPPPVAPPPPPVTPPPATVGLQGLTCTTSQLTLSSPVRCTVALTAAAPSSGATILLSSNSGVLGVPSGIVLAAGLTQADFYVVQTSLSNTAAATLTAVYGTQTINASLTLAIPAPPPAPLPTLQKLTCTSTQIAPGTPVSCTVTLSAAAPSSGASVQLSTNNPAVTIPGGVAVTPGSTQATFAISQNALTATTAATLSATYNAQTVTASLKLTAPAPASALQKVTCAATQLASRGSDRCTIFLSSPAPAGGATILFSSSNPALSVPSGIALAPGLSQADFYVVQITIATNSSATLKATYGTQSVSTTLKLATH